LLRIDGAPSERLHPNCGEDGCVAFAEGYRLLGKVELRHAPPGTMLSEKLIPKRDQTAAPQKSSRTPK
jgi:hypothetical protein